VISVQRANAKQTGASRNDADAFRVAKVLNDRGIKSPTGKAWQSVAVLRLVERLKGESRP
jgi:hypothetical protein